MSFASLILMSLALATGAAQPAAALVVASPWSVSERQQFRPGEVAEDIVSLSDPGQRYAVYLPSGYGPDRVWPVLFAMDPRGRAMVPIDLFREAAERYGYIIISSYNSASDTDGDPNTPAMQAMLADTPQLFSADERRIYIAGFSGTARVGWYFATQLGEYTAGLIGFGGGLPLQFSPPHPMTFAFFGAAGMTDFNYEEMLGLDAELAERGAAHRFVSFDGAHAWGSAETCALALDWMELQAMKNGRRETDTALVNQLYEDRRAAATALEEAGDLFGAYRLYRALAEDFNGLREIDDVVEKAEALGTTEAIRDGIDLEEKLTERSDTFFGVLSRFFSQVQTAEELPRLGDALFDLRVSSLKKEAADSSRPVEANAAQRLLEKIFVNAAFYGPRDFLREGEPDRALLLLGIADAIKEADFNVLVNFARAYALAGDRKEAIEALQRADEIVTLQPEWLEQDPYLQALSDEPGFQALLRRQLSPSATR